MSFSPWSLPSAFGALATTLLAVAASLACVAWNLAVGTSVSRIASEGRAFRALTGLSAFLLLPALVIGLLAPTAPGARVLTSLAWLWPLVTLGIASQAAWALGRRGTNLLYACPVVVFNVLIAWIAVARWTESLGAGLPPWMLTPGVALSSLGAAALGNGAYLWSSWLPLPVLVPALPARSRLGAAWRALLAATCTALLALSGTAAPRAFAQLRAERALGAGLLTERARDDFGIGLRLFGDLTAAPAPATVRHDAALADSLDVSAVFVSVTADGTNSAALDSVARVLEEGRDSVLLVVSIPFAGDGPAPGTAAEERWLATRTAMAENVVRRLHPDVLLPAGEQALAGHGPAWWKAYYLRLASAARRLDRNVTIALATAAATSLDSALCDWVGQGESPVDAIALAIPPGDGNARRFGRSSASLARWISLARTPPSVWLVRLPSAPAVDGEVAQQHLVRQALQWGSAHPWVRGVIAGDASDGWSSTGLRAASGRSRRALAEIASALHSLRESAAQAVMPADSSSGTPVPFSPTRP